MEVFMKKVTNGLVYNTETADLLAEKWNHLGCNDFYYCIEGLFKTKKGNYFLYGKGGAASKYAESNGKYSSEGSTIITFNETEAFEWLEENDLTSVIEKEFPHLIEEA